MYEIILASKSPRRKKILEDWGFKFRTFPIEVSEILNENLNLFDQISDCARQKAEVALGELNHLKSLDKILLTADTLVAFEGRVLGKPKNKKEAIQTLMELSGHSHEVVTGYCLYHFASKRLIMKHVVTKVSFHKLTLEEVEAYVETGEPMDKAGSYGIQGGAKKFVKGFDGSFLNVVGLPIEDIEEVLKENGWSIAK